MSLFQRTFIICNAAILLFLGNTACRTIQPIAPLTSEVQTPKNEKTYNQLIIPLEVDLTKYLNDAKNQVPTNYLGSNKQCQGVAYDLYFERTKVQIQAQDNLLQTQVDGKYWIKMSYCVQCSDFFTPQPTCISPRVPFSCGVGEPMPKMRLTINTSLAFTKDYHLKTQTNLAKLTPLNPCEVTLFHFDITETLMEEMNKALKKEMSNLDKSLANINFEKSFHDLWFGLQKPIPIPNIGYLHFFPKQLALSEPILDDNKLKTTLVIGTSSYVNHIEKPTEESELPELSIVSKVPVDTFELHTDFNLSYDSLSQLFTNYMASQPIQIKNKTIQINKVTMSCLNASELLIQLDFSGSKNGTLYLRGIPKIDNSQQVFSLDNLSFDIQTKNLLLKSASWMFNDKILVELKKASTISLKTVLANLKTEIDKQLDFTIGEFHVQGKAHALAIDTIEPSTEALFLRTLFRGRIQVKN